MPIEEGKPVNRFKDDRTRFEDDFVLNPLATSSHKKRLGRAPLTNHLNIIPPKTQNSWADPSVTEEALMEIKAKIMKKHAIISTKPMMGLSNENNS